MDNYEINRYIAECYNNDMKWDEIAENIYHNYGERINVQAIKMRVQRMKNNGTLDFTKDDRRPDEAFLQELEQEATGGSLFKIGCLDIETTGLWSDFGYILCAVFMDIETGKYDVIRLDETKTYNKEFLGNPENWRRIDSELCKKISGIYSEYDIIVHFNGRNFDIKFINTRLMKNRLPLLPSKKQLDIYQIARYKLRLRSKRLDALREFLEVDNDQDGHQWEYWQMAANGQKSGFDYVVDHCKKDVRRLAEVAKRMKYHINFIKE